MQCETGDIRLDTISIDIISSNTSQRHPLRTIHSTPSKHSDTTAHPAGCLPNGAHLPGNKFTLICNHNYCHSLWFLNKQKRGLHARSRNSIAYQTASFVCDSDFRSIRIHWIGCCDFYGDICLLQQILLPPNLGDRSHKTSSVT